MIDADPYPWPYDGTVDPSRLALVVAGAQPAWASRSQRAAEVAERITEVADAVRAAAGVVVHVRHGSPVRRASGLPPLTGGPEWRLCTAADEGDLVVDAAGIDGFSGSPLDGELRVRQVRQLAFAGFGAEAAVSSTLRSANDRGFECVTLSDAIAPFEEETGRRLLHSITMSGGIFGAVAVSQDLVVSLPVPVRLPVRPPVRIANLET